MRLLNRLISAVIAILISVTSLDAHSGRTDKSGGHHDRQSGGYHHHGGTPSYSPGENLNYAPQESSSLSAKSRTRVSITPIQTQSTQQQPGSHSISRTEARINGYFLTANENVGALNCNQVMQPRDVDDSTKSKIKNRDGHRCLICGSTGKLEIDHRRALMNGGTNDESNLATLCDDCHTNKTRLDNSLRRKREKLCR